MELFFYLFLSHLIGDYPLQPDWLLKMKHKSWKGVLLHVAIHFAVTWIIVSFIVGIKISFLIAFSLSLIHFIIDQTKLASNFKSGNKALFANYWIDQFCHYISIYIIVMISLAAKITTENQHENSFFVLLYDIRTINLFSIIIFTVYALEYGSHLHTASKSKKQIQTIVFNKKRIVSRLFLFILVYLGLLFIML